MRRRWGVVLAVALLSAGCAPDEPGFQGSLVAIDDTGLADSAIEDGWIVALPGPAGIERLWPGERVPDDELRYVHEVLDPDAVTERGGVVVPVGRGGHFALDIPAGPALICRATGPSLTDADVQGCAAVELVEGAGVHATVGEGGFDVSIPV